MKVLFVNVVKDLAVQKAHYPLAIKRKLLILL